MERQLFLTNPAAMGGNQQPLVINNERPAYRVLAERGFFADDVLWTAGKIIYFDDEPNEELEPLNEKARDAMMALLTKLDEYAAEVAARNGKKFVSRIKSMEEAMNQLREDSRRVSLVAGDGGVPLMGAKRKGRRAMEVGTPETPETGNRPNKKNAVQAA